MFIWNETCKILTLLSDSSLVTAPKMDISSQKNATCDMFTAKIILSTGCVVYILCLPLLLAVAVVGLKKWQKHRCMSHSDAFTFHLTALEVKNFVGTFVYYHSVYSGNAYVQDIGIILINVTSSGQLLLHCLTCVERYVAAVHPITYMRLKNKGGVTIRNISIVLTWLGAAGQALIRAEMQSTLYYTIMANIFTFSSLVVVAFCSVSVLRVLIGPKPGKNSKDMWKVDQSKRSAFITMLVITGALLMRFVVFVIHYLLTLSHSAQVDRCILKVTTPWFALPSGMILPLLFLYRERKPWIKKVNK